MRRSVSRQCGLQESESASRQDQRPDVTTKACFSVVYHGENYGSETQGKPGACALDYSCRWRRQAAFPTDERPVKARSPAWRKVPADRCPHQQLSQFRLKKNLRLNAIQLGFAQQTYRQLLPL